MKIHRLTTGVSGQRSRVWFGTRNFDWFQFDAPVERHYRLGTEALIFTGDGKTYVLTDELRPNHGCRVRVTQIGWPGRRM